MTPETAGQEDAQAASSPAQGVDNASLGSWVVCPCGKRYQKRRGRQRHCAPACRNRQWALAHPRAKVPTQPSLFEPAPGIKVHLTEGQTLASEQPRWGKDCARVVEILTAFPERWFTYEDLALHTGIRAGSIRTRVSNIHAEPSRWGVLIEKRFVPGGKGTVEVRIKGGE